MVWPIISSKSHELEVVRVDLHVESFPCEYWNAICPIISLEEFSVWRCTDRENKSSVICNFILYNGYAIITDPNLNSTTLFLLHKLIQPRERISGAEWISGGGWIANEILANNLSNLKCKYKFEFLLLYKFIAMERNQTYYGASGI